MTRTFAIAFWLLVGLCTASARADAPPSLASPDELAAQVLKSLTNARTAPEGTVFAGVRIAPDGTVTAGPLYGAPVRDERFAAIVRGLTERIRFRAAGEHRTWAVYWMFQTNGCEPPTYDVPPDVTPIRVCLVMKDGTLVAPRSAVWFAPLAELRVGRDEHVRPPELRAELPPAALRNLEGRVAGRAILALTLDRDGGVQGVEFLQAFGGEPVRAALAEWARGSKWKVPKSWWETTRDRVVYVWYELAISDECRRESPPRVAPGLHLVYTCRALQVT